MLISCRAIVLIQRPWSRRPCKLYMMLYNVRYISMSSCWAYQYTLWHLFCRVSDLNAPSVQAMQNYAITNHRTPFISMQSHHNLIYREEEREMFPTLKMFGVGCIPWSPLARWLLTRPLGEKTVRGKSDSAINFYVQHESDKDIMSQWEVANRKGASMAQDIVTASIVWTTLLKPRGSSWCHRYHSDRRRA